MRSLTLRPSTVRAALVAGVTTVLLGACSATPSPDSTGPSATADPASAATASATDTGSSLPDEQSLCGAVDEAPVVDILGGEIANRAFNPPFGSKVDVTCEFGNTTGTRSVTVAFRAVPDFRASVDDDLLDEYGEGDFPGLGVEAYRTVYKGVIAAGPHGWAVEVSVAGTVVPDDAQLAALTRAALAAAG